MSLAKQRVKARSRNSEKKMRDLSEIQRLKAENVALKRQVNRLRKELARTNADKFESIDEAIEFQSIEEQAHRSLDQAKNLKLKLIDHWRCFDCNDDFLRLIVIQRPDGGFYFRKCPSCGKRTRLKRLKKDVEGPDADGNITHIDLDG